MRGRRARHVRPAQPQRRCVGCRQPRPQTELLRLVAQDGEAVPGKGKPGRGCWLCKEERCAREAVKSGQIARALKGKARGPSLPRLREWIGLGGSLDADGGRGLKS
jgi:predicted RNA-binding protein YlxR (DUF448 family)